eukprot:Transcript_21714.p2 GENE.Transcript_21714~~Transcript_21714.p2  ORF type:complete len:357 (-),score=192.30 Transcript_21714:65-1135(-)
METSASIAAKIDDKFKVAVVDYSAPDAAKKFTDSLKSTGFAVLTNHPVSNDLIQGVYSEWRDFMIALHKHAATAQLPPDGSASDNLAEKYYRSLETQDGYFPMAVSETAKGASVKDLKHYFQCYFPHGRFPREEVSGGAQQLWSELIALGRTLVAWIDDHMPPEIKATIQQKIGEGRTLMDCVSDARTMMRILHYPGYDDANEAPGAVRAAAHEDINLITVLPAGSARGLQVKSQQSGEWYEVPLVEGSIVINIGDMMQEMSDHAYISTTHRVIKMEDAAGAAGDDSAARFASGDRMSTPCFIHLKEKCPMSAAYGSAEHYLKERLVTLGVLPREVLDAFLREYPGGVMPGWDAQE